MRGLKTHAILAGKRGLHARITATGSELATILIKGQDAVDLEDRRIQSSKRNVSTSTTLEADTVAGRRANCWKSLRSMRSLVPWSETLCLCRLLAVGAQAAMRVRFKRIWLLLIAL